MPAADCSVPCVDPIPAPEGYAKLGGTWWCAAGFIGVPKVHCSERPIIKEQCAKPRLELSGCVSPQAPIEGAGDTVPCAPPQSVYPVDQGNCQHMLPGQLCTAHCLADCATGDGLLLSCPRDNVKSSRPPDVVKGSCRATCEACAVGDFEDTDPERGAVAGALNFGAAHIDGLMDEDPVKGYAVYLATACGAKLGEALVVMPRALVPRHCCEPDIYTVTIPKTRLVAEAEQLVVVIRTALGELPTGRATMLTDLAQNIRVTAHGLRAVPNRAIRWAWAALAAVTGVLASSAAVA